LVAYSHPIRFFYFVRSAYPQPLFFFPDNLTFRRSRVFSIKPFCSRMDHQSFLFFLFVSDGLSALASFTCGFSLLESSLFSKRSSRSTFPDIGYDARLVPFLLFFQNALAIPFFFRVLFFLLHPCQPTFPPTGDCSLAD